jgi:AsmA protein
MMSPFLRVSGSGQVDLPKNSLDYVAKATVVNTATGQEGKELAELKDLSIPVRIVGQFDHLNYQLQFAQISSEALKSALKAKAAPVIEEQKKELKEKLNEEVRNKLKGLLNKN